jgi:single-strand DNA-binding protein
MARGLNKVMVIGNLGRDPEMRYLPSGHPVTEFSVASTRRWKASDGSPREETEWFHVVAWDRLAELCNEWLRQGRRVYVEGRLRTRSWETPDGQKRYRTEIIATDVIMLDQRDREAEPVGEAELPEPDEDIPY